MKFLRRLFGMSNDEDPDDVVLIMGGRDDDDPDDSLPFQLTLTEGERFHGEEIDRHFVHSVRKTLMEIESRMGPFAFVAIEQNRPDKGKHNVIVSAEWVGDDENSASVVGEALYDDLRSDLKPLLGGVKTTATRNVPAMIAKIKNDLQLFANAPELRQNNEVAFGEKGCVLAYNAKVFNKV